MHQTTELIDLRIRRFVEERLEPAKYRARIPVEVTAWRAPGEPIPFAEAVVESYEPFAIGHTWGRAWSTVWFHVTGTVPAGWPQPNTRVELVVDLGFNGGQAGFQAEGLVYAADGSIIKGIEPRNNYVPVVAGAGDPIDLFIEAAGNPDVGSQFRTFAPTQLGRVETAGIDDLYCLRTLDVALLDVPVWELLQDIWTLNGLASELGTDQPRRASILRALDSVVDAIDPSNVSGTAGAARRLLEPVLASPASNSAHRIVAVGHAHIDSAWLWPTRETVRKCVRTFSNVLSLMDEDPELIFACSSAQQLAWIKEHYPALFERIRARVAEGRFVPVGGMWVESDTNMPSGESLARQFIEGKAFFMEEFGVEPLEVWLPDSFGYTGALPQIALSAGSSSFLTQKLSWNEVNQLPNHTFNWEGIDGSRIFTHFPPVDTYNSNLSAKELAHAQRNYMEKGEGRTSLVPFGWGDGGGGPTREMMAAARRTRSLEGSPQVSIDTPAHFFEQARAELEVPAVWMGELYLEFHRGTYTSQARTKRGNRRSEALLHEAELWATTAAVRVGHAYPHDKLIEAWRIVLLQQFHDILPGSSIGWVHDQAEKNYAEVEVTLEGLISNALTALSQDGGDPLVVNSSPYPVAGLPAFGAAVVTEPGAVTAEATATGFVLTNGSLRVAIDPDGLISSIVDRARDREIVPAGTRANLLQLFRDTPTQWDAWDVDKEYRRTGVDLTEADSVALVNVTSQGAGVRVRRTFGSSTVEQQITVGAATSVVEITTRVDWHERQKLLKLAFPIDVHTATATSEIQFGHVVRATHSNTSWDSARFETPAHRWVHVSDASFGVGIANDSTYGHDVVRADGGDGRTFTTVRQSLLRAPLFPDPEADQGRHELRTSIVVGSIADSIEEGYRLRTPLRTITGSPVVPLVTSSDRAIVVETVKLARDGSGDLVVRIYEAHGSRAKAVLALSFDHSGVIETDLLERSIEPKAVGGCDDISVAIELNPFQLLTLRFADPRPRR